MPLGIVVTDLDGTLLGSRHELSPENRRTLLDLGERGVLRVVSTGRSLHSALSVLPPDIPIDFLCHSSGAGITCWPDRSSLRAVNMPHAHAAVLAAELVRRELSFMLHFAIPDSHRFFVHRGRRQSADFERRLARHAAFGSPLELPLGEASAISQALVVAGPGTLEHAQLVQALPEFQVIRTTSPLDAVSTWIEIFPRGVNKATAAHWLWQARAGAAGLRLAVGNDYNDLDLLQWADRAYVVGNAPAELRARFATVATNDDAGFSAAVRLALVE